MYIQPIHGCVHLLQVADEATEEAKELFRRVSGFALQRMCWRIHNLAVACLVWQHRSISCQNDSVLGIASNTQCTYLSCVMMGLSQRTVHLQHDTAGVTRTHIVSGH